jgi:hypothetical protein
MNIQHTAELCALFKELSRERESRLEKMQEIVKTYNSAIESEKRMIDELEDSLKRII